MPDQPALRDALHDLVADVHAGGGLQRRANRDRRPGRHLLRSAAAVLVLVALVGAALLTGDEGPEGRRVVTDPEAPTTGWRELAPFPLAPRWDASVVWTGDEVLVWGGYGTDASGKGGASPLLDDGAAYDPETDQWRTLPSAPIAGRAGAVAVWTGEEVLIWSGDGLWPDESPGAAYDPERDSWRMLPVAPIPHAVRAEGVWTGTELVVWGGATVENSETTAASAGAAYDPAANRWRVLSAAPFEHGRINHTMVWTGSEAVVWGGGRYEGPDADSPRDGASYDPTRDTWRRLPEVPIGGREDPVAAWTGTEVLLWGGRVDGIWRENGARYDPSSDQWAGMADVRRSPVGDPARSARGVWTDDRLFVWPGGVAYDPATDTWSSYEKGPISTDGLAGMAWTGDDVVLVADDSTVAAYRPPPRAEETAQPARCARSLSHLAPTYLPPGWDTDLRPGAGGGSGAPAVGHWAGEQGRFIDVWAAPGPWPVAGGEAISVFGEPGLLGDVHDGYGVSTACGFELTGYGMSKDDLRLVAEGLVDATMPFALWPESDAYQAVAATRRLVGGADPWRASAASTAKRFAHDVLGWDSDDVVVDDERGLVEVFFEGRSARIHVRQIAGRWWSVNHVSTFGDEDLPTSAQWTSREASAGIAYEGEFAESEVLFFRGDLDWRATGPDSRGEVQFDPPISLDRPGAHLVLLEDANGQVLHAWGTTVPAGPFAAG